MEGVDTAAFIQAHLPLAPVPGIPCIRLHKAQPSSGLARLMQDDPTAPYWAYYWAGGLALARYILDHRATVAGRRVLDLGAGSGLVAIAAALAGAGPVIAAEIDGHARVALALNAAANGVSLTVRGVDMTPGPPPEGDVVLVGDLFYEAVLAEHVTAFLDRCLDAGQTVLIGDPWRAHLPRARLRLLAEYQVAETGAATKAAGVFAFEGR